MDHNFVDLKFVEAVMLGAACAPPFSSRSPAIDECEAETFRVIEDRVRRYAMQLEATAALKRSLAGCGYAVGGDT